MADERPSDEWSEVDYELVFEAATGMPAMHEHLVARLGPRAGERWLDLATGTGRVARLAARSGADVTALDVSPSMLERARAIADEEGIRISFDLGDAAALPYADAEFDVVSSAVGVVFAPDHAAVARELARVCRPGGRLGIVSWRPDPGWRAAFAPFSERPANADDVVEWGREEYVLELLGPHFELRFAEGDAPTTGASGEAIWDVWLRSIGWTRLVYESLDEQRREEFRRTFVDYFETFRKNGGIEQPNAYLLTLGTRR